MDRAERPDYLCNAIIRSFFGDQIDPRVHLAMMAPQHAAAHVPVFQTLCALELEPGMFDEHIVSVEESELVPDCLECRRQWRSCQMEIE